jgi:hypothetical protein
MPGESVRARANPLKGRLFGPVFLAALLLSACVDNPESSLPDGMEPGREADRPHALTATRLLSIGDHTDDMDFFRLGEIVLEEDGGMVVADAGTRSLYWFDNAGNVRHEAGRSGSGPGEFDRITALRSVPEGIVVWDLGLRRISYFSDTGDLLHMARFDHAGAWQLVGPMTEGGLLFVRARETDGLAPSTFLAVDASGEERSRWAGPVVQDPFVRFVGTHPVSGGTVVTSYGQSGCLPTTFIVMSAGEVLSIDTGAGVVTRHPGAGPPSVLFRAGDRPPLTAERRRQFADEFSFAPPDTVRSALSRLSAYDDHLPTWNSAIAGEDGTLFLERAECGSSPDLREYDVVDTTNGRMLGRVGFPRETSSVRAVSRNLAVLVVSDSLGVGSLEVHEIRRD